jgi:hypothetical protein
MSKRSKSYRKSLGKSRRRRSKFGKSAKKIVKKMYRGAVKLGTFETKVHTYIGYFIGFLIGLLGLYFIFRTVKHSGKTTATIKSTDAELCTVKNADPKNTTYTCNFSLQYSVNGQSYEKTFSNIESKTKYAGGDTLTIYYNKSNVNDIAFSSEDSKILGFILLFVALFIIFMSWYQYYKVRKFKYFAAEEGVKTIFNMFK